VPSILVQIDELNYGKPAIVSAS